MPAYRNMQDMSKVKTENKKITLISSDFKGAQDNQPSSKRTLIDTSPSLLTLNLHLFKGLPLLRPLKYSTPIMMTQRSARHYRFTVLRVFNIKIHFVWDDRLINYNY